MSDYHVQMYLDQQDGLAKDYDEHIAEMFIQAELEEWQRIYAKLMQSAVLDDIDPKVLERVARVLGGEE